MSKAAAAACEPTELHEEFCEVVYAGRSEFGHGASAQHKTRIHLVAIFHGMSRARRSDRSGLRRRKTAAHKTIHTPALRTVTVLAALTALNVITRSDHIRLFLILLQNYRP